MKGEGGVASTPRYCHDIRCVPAGKGKTRQSGRSASSIGRVLAGKASPWARDGYFGHVVEGRIDAKYAYAAVTDGPGDGIIIADGFKHRHRAHQLSECVLQFFVEGQEKLRQG